MRRRRAVVRRPKRSERGFTLVEVMIVVALLGGAVISMVGTLYTVTTVSDQQRRTSIVDAEGRRFAEKVRAMDYTPCATTDTFNSAKSTAIDVDTSVTAVQYWNGSFTPLSKLTSDDWSDTCGSASNPGIDCGMQLVTVHIADGNVGTDLTFVKRADDAYVQKCTP